MANTYSLIAKTQLTGSQASVTFSAIPATYDDLVLSLSIRSDKSAWLQEVFLRFNGDSTTKYSYTALIGTSSAANSTRVSNDTSATGSVTVAASATSNTFGSTEIYIPSYRVSQNKPLSIIDAPEMNDTTNYQRETIASLYRSTTAISSIEVGLVGAGNYVSGSSFWLYGIKNT